MKRPTPQSQPRLPHRQTPRTANPPSPFWNHLRKHPCELLSPRSADHFCRHRTSSCTSRPNEWRVPLRYCRATSEASILPHRRMVTTTLLNDAEADLVLSHHRRATTTPLSDTDGPSGSAILLEGGNWYPIPASRRVAILIPAGGQQACVFRAVIRRTLPCRILPRRIFALEAQDRKCRTAHQKAVSRQPLQWNANLAVLCPR